MVDERSIGKRIKSVRESKNMTQAKLAAGTDISITQLSGYENGKTPSLTNLARIAQALGVTLDHLYFGNESEAFVNTAADDGHLIVNCLEQLYYHGVIGGFEFLDQEKHSGYFDDPPHPFMLSVQRYQAAIRRLLANFDEVEENIDTYADPSEYIKHIKISVANEINASYE